MNIHHLCQLFIYCGIVRDNTMDYEIFKDIEGYEGRYSISTFGRVYSHLTSKYLKPKIDNKGYLSVHLRGSKESHPTLHRLVAYHFIKNELGKETVNHIDGNKKNNHVTNLEWSSHSEQINHALSMNLIKPRGNHIYSDEFKFKVKEYYLTNKCSLYELASLFNISQRSAKRFIEYEGKSYLKIKDLDVQKILNLRNNGMTLKSIAELFNCGISQIHRITKGLSRNVKYER